jgi:hypothetical protein
MGLKAWVARLCRCGGAVACHLHVNLRVFANWKNAIVYVAIDALFTWSSGAFVVQKRMTG